MSSSDAARIRLVAFRDAVAAIHEKVQDNLERQEKFRKDGLVVPEGLLGREMGLCNAMAAVLRIAVPDAADGEDAIETLAAVEDV